MRSREPSHARSASARRSGVRRPGPPRHAIAEQAPRTRWDSFTGSQTVRDLRRAQVIAQARRIVAEDGLEALTIGALEQRLDFSRGVITYHFRDKDDLVDAVLQSAIEEIDAAAMSEVQASPTPQAKLGAVLRSMVRGFIERPEAGRILLSFWGRLVADARVRKVNADLYARYRAETRILLEHGREAGAFAAVPADALAALVVGTVIGIATQAYFEPGAIDVESAIEEAHRALLARLAPPQRQRRRAHRETGRQGGASEDS